MHLPDPPTPTDDVGDLLARQADYYERFAPEYADWITRYMTPVLPELISLTKGAMRGARHILELAPGPGTFTAALAEVADHVTALDASRSMLTLLAGLNLRNLSAVQLDLFAWEPDGTLTYDGVFMSNWLAHVPPDLVPQFFAKVARVLNPSGRVCIVDVTPTERFIEAEFSTQAGAPTVTRQAGGASYPVVKKYWQPAELLAFLAPHGWIGTATEVGGADRGFVFYHLTRLT